MVRYFAVNGSPRGRRGLTALMLRALVEGLGEGGATPADAPTGTEVWELGELDIRPCRGDWACWTGTPGRCVQNDDMNRLYPLIRSADLLILGTPVYVDGMTGPLKTFVDRLVALLDPMIELRHGHSRHPLHQGGGDDPELPEQRLDAAQIVLVSVCGFYELDNFHPLVAHVEAIARNLGRRYGGALLRPHAPALPVILRSGQDDGAARDVLEAARQAGRELAAGRPLDPSVATRVAQPLTDRDTYNQRTNDGWPTRPKP